MGINSKTLYTLLPISNEFGEQDFPKTIRFAKGFSIGLIVTWATGLLYFVGRLIRCYPQVVESQSPDSTDESHIYYAVMTALTSYTGIHVLSLAFALLFFVGAAQKQDSLIFLWIISVFVLMSLLTLVTVYHSAVKDHLHAEWTFWERLDLALYIWEICLTVPGMIVAVILYRAIQRYHEELEDQREFLL